MPPQRSYTCRIQWIAAVVAAIFSPFIAVQAEIPAPTTRTPVIDETGVLGSAAKDIESKIVAFRAEKGAEIGVLIVPTTQPETIEQYSIRVVETWKLGRKGIDDGVLLLVALSDRAVRIEVGRGFEGDLTDLRAHRIIDEQILPRFRAGDIPGGVTAGVDAIIAVAHGIELPPPYRRSEGRDNTWIIFLVIVLFLAGSVLSQIFGSFTGSAGAGLLGSLFAAPFLAFPLAIGLGLLIAFLVLFREPIMWGLAQGGRYRGGGGGGSWGTGGGGFGSGGTFSGGGASGRW